jgi:alkyl sulfatase BDS1-like metallo-beta-lactamase superfamily hydrolase
VPENHYKPADIEVSMDAKTWAALYLNTTTMEEAMKTGGVKITKGTVEDLRAVFDLFDNFDPAKNYTIPPTSSDF